MDKIGTNTTRDTKGVTLKIINVKRCTGLFLNEISRFKVMCGKSSLIGPNSILIKQLVMFLYKKITICLIRIEFGPINDDFSHIT